MNIASFGKKKLLVVFLAVAVVGWLIIRNTGSAPPAPVEVQPVGVARASLGTVPEYYPAIGTVTPYNSVIVQSRVDGFLTAAHFVEGQKVKEGDLLVEIDPRPFEIQLKQAEAALARDMALLKEARLDLERYRKLIKEESVSLQQLQSKESLVGQYEGAVMADEASIADAKLQLTYSRVTAPITGRLGLKSVDVGDMIRSSDANGIVRITQTDPSYVVFTVVEKRIPDVLAAMREHRTAAKNARMPGESAEIPVVDGLLVEAWDQQNTRLLASGGLLTLDNQIDTATGMVKAKALFRNEDDALFPNQFVNVRLLVRNLENVLVIPTSAVQRSNEGFFVFVITPEERSNGQGEAAAVPEGGMAKNNGAGGRKSVLQGTASVRRITSGYGTDAVTVIVEGLAPGDIVVTDGVDRLREGSPVSFTAEAM